jgi:hypothetical protein
VPRTTAACASSSPGKWEREVERTGARRLEAAPDRNRDRGFDSRRLLPRRPRAGHSRRCACRRDDRRHGRPPSTGLGSVRPEILVVAPSRHRFLDRWMSDLGPGREQAQRRLVLSLASLAKAGIGASARIADEDVVQAAEDELRSFPATEVVLVTGARGRDGAGDAAAADLESRLEASSPPLHRRHAGGSRCRGKKSRPGDANIRMRALEEAPQASQNGNGAHRRQIDRPAAQRAAADLLSALGADLDSEVCARRRGGWSTPTPSC